MDDVVQYSFLTDISGKPLNGGKYYRFHLPSVMPACNFWSVIVYDSETDLMIQTDQPWPSVHCNCKKLEANKDGSVDAWFVPKVLPDKAGNCIKTIPGKGWYMILRLYGTTEDNYYKHWRPGEIEEIKVD